MKAVIVGAGGYGEVYLDYLRSDSPFDIVGFLDDSPEKLGHQVRGVPVIGSTADYDQLRQQGVQAVFAPLGDNVARVRVLTRAISHGLETPNYIHSSAIVPASVPIGRGVYILAGTIVMPCAEIGDFCMLSMGVKLAHHTRLGQGVFLSTGVNMGAEMDVGEYANLGIGSTVMTGVKVIGAHAVVGAGAVVIRDVPAGVTVAGVPAKVLTKG